MRHHGRCCGGTLPDSATDLAMKTKASGTPKHGQNDRRSAPLYGSALVSRELREEPEVRRPSCTGTADVLASAILLAAQLTGHPALSMAASPASQHANHELNCARYASRQACINDIPSGGSAIIPPGTYNSSRQALLINHQSHISIRGYGAIIKYTGQDPSVRLIEVRSSNWISIEGITLTSNGHLGTAFSQRRPSDSDAGYSTQYNTLRNSDISGFNVGIETGVDGEGQVDQAQYSFIRIADCNTHVLQDDDQTEVVRYDHVITTGGPGNATYWDIRQASAEMIQPVTGGGEGLVGITQLRLGSRLRNLTILDPHFEANDQSVTLLDWQCTSAQVTVIGGVFLRHSTSGATVLFDFSHPGSGGMIQFHNVIVDNTGGGTGKIIFQPHGGVQFQNGDSLGLGWTGVAYGGNSISDNVNRVYLGYGNAKYLSAWGATEEGIPRLEAAGTGTDIPILLQPKGKAPVKSGGSLVVKGSVSPCTSDGTNCAAITFSGTAPRTIRLQDKNQTLATLDDVIKLWHGYWPDYVTVDDVPFSMLDLSITGPVTILGMSIQAAGAPAGCMTNPGFYVTDGSASTPPVSVNNGAYAASGPLNQYYGSGHLTLRTVGGAGCKAELQKADVTVYYR